MPERFANAPVGSATVKESPAIAGSSPIKAMASSDTRKTEPGAKDPDNASTDILPIVMNASPGASAMVAPGMGVKRPIALSPASLARVMKAGLAYMDLATSPVLKIAIPHSNELALCVTFCNL